MYHLVIEQRGRSHNMSHSLWGGGGGGGGGGGQKIAKNRVTYYVNASKGVVGTIVGLD